MSSYVLEMRLFDPSYVNLCDEAFTLSTENCAGDPRSHGRAVKDWHQYHSSKCQTVSSELGVHKQQCQQSHLSLTAPCEHSAGSHVITLYVSLPEQSVDMCRNDKNLQLAGTCLACIMPSSWSANHHVVLDRAVDVRVVDSTASAVELLSTNRAAAMTVRRPARSEARSNEMNK